MTTKDWVAASGIIAALIGAGISYGRAASELEDARREIALLREDVRAINQHFILWASRHTDAPRAADEGRGP